MIIKDTPVITTGVISNVTVYKRGMYISKSLQHLDLLSDRLKKTLYKRDIQIKLAEGYFVPDFYGWEWLASFRPRGWGDEDTWLDVSAVYDSNEGVVLCGVEEELDLLHEIGHAIDATHGNKRLCELDYFKEVYEANYDILSEYHKQDGIAGLEETWAQNFARYILYRNSVAPFNAYFTDTMRYRM